MQVPASITLTNGNSPHPSHHHHHQNYPSVQRSVNAYFDNAPFGMEVPEKLTGLLYF
jgi:hypothetical protein